MGFKVIIYDSFNLPYNVDIEIIEKKHIKMNILENENNVGYLIGMIKNDNIFKLNSIYIYKEYRGRNIASEVLKILYSLIPGYTIVGLFLPFSLEDETADMYELANNFYKKNYFSLSNNMLVRPVQEYESSYEIIEDKLIKRVDSYDEQVNPIFR